MKKELPFDFNPAIKTYPTYAYTLGIIGGTLKNKVDWMPWLCNKYINCYVTRSPELKFDVLETDKLFIKENVVNAVELIVDVEKYSSILSMSQQDFVEYIQKSLLSNSYVWGTHNEKYIEQKSQYKEIDHLHGYLIYGFDDSQRVFYCATYVNEFDDNMLHVKKKLFKEMLLPYDQYFKSVFQQAYPKVALKFLKLNSEYSFELNLYELSRDLTNYLFSTTHYVPKKLDAVFGIDAWIELIIYLNYSKQIDIRFVRIFVEHHILMFERLKYLSSINIITNEIINEYEIAKIMSEKAFINLLKYISFKDEMYRLKVIDLIRRVIEVDKNILSAVLYQIEEKQ